MAKKLIFKIHTDGHVESEAEGFKGKGCLETTQKYLRKLGGTVTDRKFKDEYYESPGIDLTINN